MRVLLPLNSRRGNALLVAAGAVFTAVGALLLVWSIRETWELSGLSQHAPIVLALGIVIGGLWVVACGRRGLSLSRSQRNTIPESSSGGTDFTVTGHQGTGAAAKHSV